MASNPVDVVRTRMMNQRGVALYQGTLDCILQVSNRNLRPVQIVFKFKKHSIDFSNEDQFTRHRQSYSFCEIMSSVALGGAFQV